MGDTDPKLRLLVNDFSPGWMTAPESDRIPPGSSPDALNADFDKVDMVARTATLRKRTGTKLLNPTAMSAGKKVDGLFEFRRTTTVTRLLMAICNGALYQFDNVDTFAAVVGGGGFTAGDSARVCFYRNNAIVFDGTQAKRYDGASVFDLGFVRPTAVTNMTAVAPAGAGITGTYEAYYVWYDQLMDHESSPSDLTTQVAFAAQDRHHTKPTGAPPANVTHWRGYVRRVDTNELNFFLAVTVPVATATFNEAISDTARRQAGAGVGNSDNDPPAGPFAILAQWKGYGIGVLVNDDSFYTSKSGDLESWNPANKFPVNRGDGEAILSVNKFGTDILIQKGHATFHLTGDTVPFTIEPLHSRWGNVSQEAGLEVDGKFYAWDRERGPYMTDTVNWTSLVDGRITPILGMVNRNALGDIRAVYDEATHIIRWAVPLNGTTRKRSILKWHVGLSCWLPPDSGLEYGSFATFTTSDGTLGVYVGDYWGRVFQLSSGDREGVPSGTLSGVPTAAAANSVTCGAAAFDVTGSGLAGLPVAAVSKAGVWQWRRIASNTGTQLTLDTVNDSPWDVIPDATYMIVVGGIQWYWTSPWFDFGAPERQKQLGHFTFQGRSTASNDNVAVHARFNDSEAAITPEDYSFPAGSLSGGLWGTLIWGTDLWAQQSSRRTRRARIGRNTFSMQLLFSNYFPDQPVAMTAFLITGDPSGRQVPGYGA